MIITQTPFRMSFFGGGTDFPGFYREHGGAVLSTTFDKYCYVNVRHLPRFFDSVSYTHLDVYKRQVRGSEEFTERTREMQTLVYAHTVEKVW